MPSRFPRPAAKIAVLRASRIGDFLCAVPAFRALRRSHPEARISLIGLPFLAPLVERSPYIDRLIHFPGFPGIAEQFYDPETARAFLQRMRAERFDVVLQMHGSGANSNPVAVAMNGKYTAGFVRAWDKVPELDASFPYDPLEHETSRLLSFLQFLGIEATDPALEFTLTAADRAAADLLLRPLPGPIMALHPYARATTKCWPVERFVRLGKELLAAVGGTVVIVGEGEWSHADAHFSDLSGKTDLPLLGAVLERADLLVTNDSAPAHIAYAVRTPSVTIFGGTRPESWGPRQDTRIHRCLAHPVPCRPCDEGNCPIDLFCLRNISVNQVMDAAVSLLGAPAAKSLL